MPAQRSRTLNWRRCLEQLHERSGSLEIAVARDYDPRDSSGRHLLWRVRLLSMSDTELILERPITMGEAIELNTGIELIGIITIGQNRWMFRTTNLGVTSQPGVVSERGGRSTLALRIAMPEQVERCQRREFYRVETASLSLPEVEVWPLLDPKSVLLAERANELQFEDESAASPRPNGADGSDLMMPDVGPKFAGKLMNIGGGGVGLLVAAADAQPLARHKLFWMRFHLVPELRAPISVTAKLMHSHLDASQNTYAGMAFDFTFNPAHQQFVLDQIRRYIALQQRAQLLQIQERSRKSA